MTYLEEADETDDPITGPIWPLHPASLDAPTDTNFTTAEPDTPIWQQLLNTPAAKELGLESAGEATARRRWRKTLHSISGGTVAVRSSASDAAADLAICRPRSTDKGAAPNASQSCRSRAVSEKPRQQSDWAATFSSWRGDRVIAVDANPDFGTLAQRGPNQTQSTVRDLLADDEIVRYSDIRRHTSQSSSRLELLASERDPRFRKHSRKTTIELYTRFLTAFTTSSSPTAGPA